MKKRILTAILAAAMTMSVMSGCGENSESNSTPPPPQSDQSSQADASTESEATADGYDGKENLRITDDPMTLTLFYAFGGNGAPTGDMLIWQEAAEITGITMENVANESITDELESLNTMIASGELPDLIQGNRTNITPLITQGAFINLDDLIAQYAPNIQKFLEDYPDAVNAGTGTDGHMYLISGTLGGDPGKQLPSMGYFIRQDWLDKLNLEVPTTLEEYEDVLYAFRNNDPNGNGQKDEYPYFYRDLGIWPLLQLWDAHNSWYIDDETDQVCYGPAMEEYKTALKALTQWYADGIIDPEIFTRGSQARQFMLGNDIGGTTVDWFSSTGAINDTVREQVPDINFVAIAPPANINGEVTIQQGRASLHAYAWGISKDCKDPVAAIKYMDFFFSDVGRMLSSWGVEGVSYELVDGEPVPTEEALSNPAGYPNYLRSIGAYEIGSYGNLEGELSAMNKQAREGFELYANSDWVQPQFPTLTFTEEEQKVKDDNEVNISTAMSEYEQSVLLGVEDLDASWDNHIAMLKEMGLEELLAAYNSAYERYKG